MRQHYLKYQPKHQAMKQIDAISNLSQPKERGQAQQSAQTIARGHDDEEHGQAECRFPHPRGRRQHHDGHQSNPRNQAGRGPAPDLHQRRPAHPIGGCDSAQKGLQDRKIKQTVSRRPINNRADCRRGNQCDRGLPCAAKNEAEERQGQVEQPLIAERPGHRGDQHAGVCQTVQVRSAEHQQPLQQRLDLRARGSRRFRPGQYNYRYQNQPEHQQINRIKPVKAGNEEFTPVHSAAPGE